MHGGPPNAHSVYTSLYIYTYIYFHLEFVIYIYIRPYTYSCLFESILLNSLIDKLNLRLSAPISRTVWLLDAVASFSWAGGGRGRGSKWVRYLRRDTPRPPTGYGHPEITSLGRPSQRVPSEGRG